MASVLIVDDEAGIREFMSEALRDDGHDVRVAANGEEGLATLEREHFEVVLTDLKMPGIDGMTLLSRVRERHPDVEVIMLTAHGSVDTAVRAMREGAYDYLQKPIGSLEELRILVRRAAERHAHRRAEENARGHEAPPLTWGAPAMQSIVLGLRKVATTDATVLLLGESGTGKEVAARTIHLSSRRCDGPFVAVNCAALGESLLESELFGHEKGAFTGAVARRRGRIELAAGGTFFLDEVGELAPNLQSKLLRVLQERCFERVGGDQSVRADVRWIAATNRDLARGVAQGWFREDLYHRLSVFPIHLPPLRDRLEDLEPLANTLLHRICAQLGRSPMRLHPSALAALGKQRWSGNVRELANVLERAAILNDREELHASHLGLPSAGASELDGASGHDAASNGVVAGLGKDAAGGNDANESSLRGNPARGESSTGVVSGIARGTPRTPSVRPLVDVEREAIAAAMVQFGGNRTRAAEALGIGVRTLYDKLKRFGMD